MADYFPLIAKAIDGLADKSPAIRRAVYERARKALVTQLQTLDPPATASDIERERVALDLAIGAVEARYILPAQQTAAEAELPREPTQILLEPIGFEKAAEEDSGPVAETPEAPEASEDSKTPETSEAGESGEEEAKAGDEPLSEEAEPVEITGPERPRIETKHLHSSGQANRVRVIILVASVLAVVVSIAGWKLYNHNIEQQQQAGPSPADSEPQQDDAAGDAPSEPGKFSERLGGEVAPARQETAAGTEAATVAVQRSILFETDPSTASLPMNEQKLIASAGVVHWGLEQMDAGEGRPLDTVVRAQVDFPQSGFKLDMKIRKNSDGSAYSHIIELVFAQAASDTSREVVGVAPLQVKDSEEEVRGPLLIGMVMPVAKNVFVIGLSDIPSEMERNGQLMRDKNWFDVSVVFPDGRRGLISIEKGPTGFQVIADAFRRW